MLKLGLFDGAYYLAGYAVECALKACIAKRTQRGEFPERKKVESSHSHDLWQLIKVAGLEEARFEQAGKDPDFRMNWNVVQSWSEQSRYRRHRPESVHELLLGSWRQAALGDLMDKVAMVSVDISTGSELLDTLDRAKVKVSVALWVLLSEYEDWRLVISARQFDSLDLRDAYRLVHDSLAPAGFTPRKTPPIMILPMADPFIKELRRLFGKTKSVEGMRIGGQMIGDRFVEDGYVYRIS